MKPDLLSRLVELDAAPRAGLSTAELDRKEELLRTVLRDTNRPSRPAAPAYRRPLVRRTAYTIAAGLAAGAALLTVTADPPGQDGSGPLSASEVASWTATADDSDDANLSFSRCFRKTKDVYGDKGWGAISNADRRGTTTSMIVTRHGRAAYCMAGSDGSGMAVSIGPAVDVPANDITLDAQGTRGSGSTRFRYAVGSVGEGVKEITLRDQGRTVHAHVQLIPTLPYGRWTAWWPESDSHDRLTGTLTLKDGTTRTINGETLTK
ncbi:hypothetical protein [Streptomyces sp. NPDC055105]|uniref:hypothetical protein n=1 Tax=Streptomyces sp. NPDC055105 TaxID=3365719 RepID=UPI0037D3814C